MLQAFAWLHVTRAAQAAAERRGEYDFSKAGVLFGEDKESELNSDEMDALLCHSCQLLQRNGFDEGHLPPRLELWLKSGEGELFLENCCEIFSRLDRHAAAARDGELLAWMVRAVQLQLREIAPKVSSTEPPSVTAQCNRPV